MLAAPGKHGGARDGTRDVPSKDGNRQAWAGGERPGSLLKQQRSEEGSAVKCGETANPAGRPASSRGLQTVTALPFDFVLLLPPYFLSGTRSEAGGGTVPVTMPCVRDSEQGAPGRSRGCWISAPQIVFARALHCRKDHVVPPQTMHKPLVPQGLGHLLASSFRLGVSRLHT